MKKKNRKNNQINQSSFYFEDYLETNKKSQIIKKKIIFKTEFTYYFLSFFH